MASLTIKRIGGRSYYYLRECQRVDGQPKIVRQKYLGTAEEVARLLAGAAAPSSPIRDALVHEWGALVALFDVAQSIKLVEVVDRHVPKRSGSPLSVGMFLLIAALNRCVAPRSKSQIAAWFEGTVLPGLLSVQPSQLTSQRFWDHMDRIDEKALRAIEHDLTAEVVSQFKLDLRALLFDETNFFTFIHSFNTRSTLAQRGHSKEGRESLRILGLALLVTADFEIPLFHRVYPGNQTDAPTFRSVIDDLVARYRLLEQTVDDITLVFDKGNNASDILESLDASPYHFVGSLVLSQHKDLSAIPSRQLAPLKGIPGVRCRRVTREAMGQSRTVLVTYNQELFDSQARTFEREINKRLERLHKLQVSLARWHSGKLHGNKPTVASTQKSVDSMLAARHMKSLFSVKVTKAGGLPKLRFRFRKRVWQSMRERQLGKTILFTDRKDWSDAQIVTVYRSQWHVEHAFRRMKNVRYLSFRPQFHWTDQKLKVHALYCVMALLLVSLLRKRLHDAGIDLGTTAILEKLSAIKQVHALEAGKAGRPRAVRTLTKRDELQQRVVTALDLMRYESA